MTLYLAVYFEANLVGILLMLVILYKLRKDGDRQIATLAFDRVGQSILGILVLDALWVFAECAPPEFAPVNCAVNVFYMFATGLICFLWMRYVLYKLSAPSLRRKWLMRAAQLPLAGLAVLCAATPWTGWLFTVGVDNIYRRGPLHFLQQLTGYCYVIGGCAYALYRGLRERDKGKRADAMLLASFVVLPALGSFINNFFYGVPAIWPFAAVSFAMVYMNLQSQQVSTDGLTGLNNRRQFDRYLHTRTTDRRREEPMFLLLMDIDAFKRINDTYGHLAGDGALVETAELLKQVCGRFDAFLARYGGDEFAILLEGDDPALPERVSAALRETFAFWSDGASEPYRLSLSIGCAPYVPGRCRDAEALIDAADRALYEAKKRADTRE